MSNDRWGHSRLHPDKIKQKEQKVADKKDKQKALQMSPDKRIVFVPVDVYEEIIHELNNNNIRIAKLVNDIQEIKETNKIIKTGYIQLEQKCIIALDSVANNGYVHAKQLANVFEAINTLGKHTESLLSKFDRLENKKSDENIVKE